MKFLIFNKIQKVLHFFVLIFPLIIVLKSAAINITLTVLSLISICLIIVKKKYFFFKDYFIQFIIFFFIFIFINSLLNFHKLEIVLKSLSNFRYLFLTFAVFITLESISKKNYKLFLVTNSALIILIGLDIIYQFNFGKNIIGLLPGMCDVNQENCVRFSGIFGSELIAGAYISQIGLLFFYLIINNNQTKTNNLNQIILFSFLLFLFFIIILTGERNALLIFLISTFLFFFLQKKIKLKNFLILNFIFILSLIIISYNSHSIKSRYINFFDITISKKNISFIEKLKNTPWSYHYQAAYELFLQKPILGHGHKSFRIKCFDTKIDKKTLNDRDKFRNFRGCSSHPHSYVMEFLSENGILGLLFFLILYLIILKKTLNLNALQKNQNNYIIIGIGSLLLAILFPFKPSGSFFTTFNSSLLFYLLGFFHFYTKQIK